MSGLRTCASGDRSLMSRDIGHSGAAVVAEAKPGGRSRGGDRRAALWAGLACPMLVSLSCRSCPSSCRSLRPPRSTGSLAGICSGCWRAIARGLEALQPRSRRPKTHPTATSAGPDTDHRAARPTGRNGQCRAGHDRLAPRTRRSRRRHRRRSAGSCPQPGWSPPNRANARGRRSRALKQPSRTRPGNRMSPTGD